MILITEGPRRKSRGGAGSGIMAEDEPFWRRMDHSEKEEKNVKEARKKEKKKTNKQTNKLLFQDSLPGGCAERRDWTGRKPGSGWELASPRAKNFSLSRLSVQNNIFHFDFEVALASFCDSSTMARHLSSVSSPSGPNSPVPVKSLALSLKMSISITSSCFFDHPS